MFFFYLPLIKFPKIQLVKMSNVNRAYYYTYRHTYFYPYIIYTPLNIDRLYYTGTYYNIHMECQHELLSSIENVLGVNFHIGLPTTTSSAVLINSDFYRVVVTKVEYFVGGKHKYSTIIQVLVCKIFVYFD